MSKITIGVNNIIENKLLIDALLRIGYSISVMYLNKGNNCVTINTDTKTITTHNVLINTKPFVDYSYDEFILMLKFNTL